MPFETYTWKESELATFFIGTDDYFLSIIKSKWHLLTACSYELYAVSTRWLYFIHSGMFVYVIVKKV